MTSLPAEAAEVLDFWFREIDPEQWFRSGEALDGMISERFAGLLDKARDGALDDWRATPRGRLALVILLDQFPRHIFRGRAEAFASDTQAQALAIETIEAALDETLNFAERHFLYMPLMHAEDAGMQALSVVKFEQLRDFAESLLGFARQHRDTIGRFGRFPGRNASLGRSSTPEELASLEAGSQAGR